MHINIIKKIISLFALVYFGMLNVNAQPFRFQAEWEHYFKNKANNLDPIEGVWSLSVNYNIYNNSEVLINNKNQEHILILAIYKKNNDYFSYVINQDEPKQAEIKFIKTAASNGYIIETFDDMSFKTSIKTTAILTDGILINYSYKDTNQYKSFNNLPDGYSLIFNNELLKIYPIENDIKTEVSSGTGFAISSNGIIATNYHVIDGAKSIRVRGINFDFDRFYNAKVLGVDINNDLALIKIDDVNFSSLGTIPYTIKTNIESAGENVFVLGYPLRATMGEEIKLTNGIISSKTGFKGDPTSYQISAPIQPGNSGGPLFDKNGNLIGIVNAKHTGAENVSYAIKTQYLINLLDTLSSKPKLQSVNLLINKSLIQQVELAKKKVYIIEIE